MNTKFKNSNSPAYIRDSHLNPLFNQVQLSWGNNWETLTKGNSRYIFPCKNIMDSELNFTEICNLEQSAEILTRNAVKIYKILLNPSRYLETGLENA